MLQIRKHSDGTVLDLDPDASFEMTIEQPMFEESRAPVPFSSPIAFPPTSLNRREFGYLAAMLAEPSVKEMMVDIFFSGALLMTGTLVYDDVDIDGNLNYTFSGRNPEEDWNKKIYECVDPGISTIAGRDPNTRMSFLQQCKDGKMQMAAPPIINKPAVSKTIEKQLENTFDTVEYSVKYQSHPFLPTIFTPSFKIMQILGSFLKDIELDKTFEKALSQLAIIAQYKEDGVFNTLGLPMIQNYDCQKMLPDRTAFDILQNLLKMFCAYMFWTPKGYVITSFNTAMQTTATDWEDKVSDIYALSYEDRECYSLTFKNSGEEDTYDASSLSADIARGDIESRNSFSEVVAAFGMTDFRAVRHTPSGCIFSGVSRNINAGDASHPRTVVSSICDSIYANNEGIDTSAGNEDRVYDCSIDFNVVKCVIDNMYDYRTDGYGRSDMRLVPVIDPAPIGKDRGKDVYIGILVSNQLVDRGRFISGGRDGVSSMSIIPSDLFVRYHGNFAKWISVRRQTVSVDLDLRAEDLLVLRMDCRVHFRSRNWFIKTLRLTFSASSEKIDASGDFVVCP